MDVVGKPLPGLKVIDSLPRLLHRNCAFKMTLHANRVAPVRRQLGWIHNRVVARLRIARSCSWRAGRSGSRFFSVPCAVPMTSLAGDSAMQKGGPGEFIFRS